MDERTSLDELAAQLRATLAAEDREMSFRPIAARLVLRTGVDLRMPSTDQQGDPDVISKVRAALADMGFGLDKHDAQPQRSSL